MAQKTIIVCDNCNAKVPEPQVRVMKITAVDYSFGSKTADLCVECAMKMPGERHPRRGRPPAHLAAVN